MPAWHFPIGPAPTGTICCCIPWLKSAGAKFLEHGHRLAGIVIGMASIALAVDCPAVRNRRLWVRRLAYGVLVGGHHAGNSRRPAGAARRAGIGICAWQFRGTRPGSDGELSPSSPAAIGMRPPAFSESRVVADRILAGSNCWPRSTCGCVFVQYMLGGLLRHQGKVLYEHLGFAFVAALMVIWLAMAAAGSGNAWLRGPAIGLAVLTILQLALGAGAWITKFGFDRLCRRLWIASFRWSRGRPMCMCGMLLFVTCVVLTVRIARVAPPVVGEIKSFLADRPAC